MIRSTDTRWEDSRPERERMVDKQIAARGIRDERVLAAMRRVPREAFLDPDQREAAYEDRPLGIAAGQTISQPFIVARMTEALDLDGEERVLEIGTGSGYAAAVLGEIVDEVHTVERHAALAEHAAAALADLDYPSVHVHIGDGSRGYRPAAPYDAVVVTAAGPAVPESLRRQLAIGGRLVMPVAETAEHQVLVRVTRQGEDDWHEERLDAVRFVPLVGVEAWRDADGVEPGIGISTQLRRHQTRVRQPGAGDPAPARQLLTEAIEAFDAIETADLEPLLQRIGDARVVCIGEATHGSAEFYRMRSRITRLLIERGGFDMVAIEADWPDAARIDRTVRARPGGPADWTAFGRFPSWMWRNEEVRDFVDWLTEHNRSRRHPSEQVSVHGLDLYSLYASIDRILAHLDEVDPAAADLARQQYSCLEPWQPDPIRYAQSAATGRFTSCRAEVVTVLQEMLERRMDRMAEDGEEWFDATQNARLVADAEEYYRRLYEGPVRSWNLRDSHMFDCLQQLLEHRGPAAKVVVWAHNSHLGDARGTERSQVGEHNLGQLCREAHGDQAYLIGFGTHGGTVAAAHDWGGEMAVMDVRPALPDSVEGLCHGLAQPRFFLPLRNPTQAGVRTLFTEAMLQRAIGVIYRPATERESHYFHVRLAEQFDEYIWFDQTSAVTPLGSPETASAPDTFPSGF